MLSSNESVRVFDLGWLSEVNSILNIERADCFKQLKRLSGLLSIDLRTVEFEFKWKRSDSGGNTEFEICLCCGYGRLHRNWLKSVLTYVSRWETVFRSKWVESSIFYSDIYRSISRPISVNSWTRNILYNKRWTVLSTSTLVIYWANCYVVFCYVSYFKHFY